MERVITVTSADGTPIGARIIGAGQPVVVVHGSSSTGEAWRAVAEALADRYAVYLVDRRGRGLSGAGNDAYAIGREADDIGAVMAAAGAEIVVGHSFGATCVLEGLVAGVVSAARVVLYEPPLPVDGPVAGDALASYAALVDAGALDEALTLALSRIVRMPDSAVAAMRRAPDWAARVALAPVWVRELRAIDALTADVSRYASIKAPTQLLLGTETSANLAAATRALSTALPSATVSTLSGHGHVAHVTAPGLVAGLIDRFLAAG